MPKVKVSRRELLPVAVASAGILASIRPALSQRYSTPPVKSGIAKSQEAQCSVSEAISSLAEKNELFKQKIELALEQLAKTIEFLETINADNGSESLPNPGRFSNEILSIVPNDNVGSLETVYDHARVLLQASRESSNILENILRNETNDEAILRLFALLYTMSLLNASAVGFAT